MHKTNHIAKLFVCLLTALTAAACSEGSNELVTGYGDISFRLSVNEQVLSVAGAPQITSDAVPSSADLRLTAENVISGQSKSWENLTAFESGSGKLPVGEYLFTAYYGNPDEEGFVEPAWKAQTTANVFEDRESIVELECRQAQTSVSAQWSTDGLALQKIALRLKSAAGNYMTIPSGTTDVARLRPGTIKGELSLTDATGRSVTLQPFAINGTQPAEHYQFRIGGDVNRLTAVYDETTLASPYTLDIDESLFATPSPVFALMGTDATGTVSLLELTSPSSPLGCSLTVPGGLQHLYVTILSTTMTDNPFAIEADLLDYDDSELPSRGITAEGLAEGSTAVRLDFSDLSARMRSDGDNPTVTRIVIQAQDAAGRVADAPAEITVVSRPVQLRLTQPAKIATTATQAEIEMTYNGDAPADNVRFQIYNSLDDDGYNDVTPVSITKTADDTYRVLLPVGDGMERRMIRAVCRTGGRMSNEVTLSRDVPEYKVMCADENVWPSRVDLMFAGDALDEVIPYVSVLVREDSGDLRPAVVERSVSDRRITIKTLSPQTTYNIEVRGVGTVIDRFSLTTEKAVQLTNGDFDKVKETIKMKGVNCGGKYSNALSWMPIYNKADIIVNEPEKFASVNAKTCASFASTSNTWFQVPTTEIVTTAYSGQYAVRLRNAGWSWDGEEPSRDARTDHQYYSGKAPTIDCRSAGKLFLGSYSVDKTGKETYNEGIPFSSRPTSIAGMYTYVRDNHDPEETGMVEITMLHEENGVGEVIGRGVGYLQPSTSFTRFVVPVAYTVRDKNATHLRLMISSSNHASADIDTETRLIKTTNYLEKGVSIGAQLVIDDLTLLYE